MAGMAVKDLTQAQCILLAVHYASEANTKALHSFTPLRPDVLDPELVLRIVLTYLPESVEPKQYTTYVEEVASRLYLDVEREDVPVDLTPVKDIDDGQAQKRVKKLHLLDMKPPSFPRDGPEDILTRFICHRAYRIDSETGLLNMVPQLIEPFLARNQYLRVWYISVVLPLLRINYEYYPGEDVSVGLADFEKMDGREGTDFLLSKAIKEDESPAIPLESSKSRVGRDVKGLVGPYMYGHTERERRKVHPSQDESLSSLARGVRKISLANEGRVDKTGHDWEYVYKWLVQHSQQHFVLITRAIEEWDGPSDVDSGGFDKNYRPSLDEDLLQKLELQYAQTAFASCYAAQAETEATIRGAHEVLARLAELLDFIPPPDLATSVESLPKIERQESAWESTNEAEDLHPTALLRPDHPLTAPTMKTYMLLQMMVYSAYQFSGLGHPISILNVTKLHSSAPAEEQLACLQRILQGLSKSGRRDEAQWTHDRAKLIWLWNWGIDGDDQSAKTGAGVLGRIEKEDFEEAMLKVFTETSCYSLIIKLFLEPSLSRKLPLEQAESVILAKAMEAYDGASNGNRTRGGVRKASDIINNFRPYFRQSQKFDEAAALIAATHALSFYSLTLQHGVPFQPVSIRVSKDPIELINKVLEQNPRSYTKLDDLVDIAQNLVSAGLFEAQNEADANAALSNTNSNGHGKQRKDAERRVTFMAIEAALREDDFETAYSYIVSRLTPSIAEITGPRSPDKVKHSRDGSKSSILAKPEPIEDDISWRAAYLAGRYRPSTSGPPTLRRLEQRTELLSLALLLAPVSSLNDILSAWRRCEEEVSALQRSQQQEEEDFDDRADRREPSALPGNFSLTSDQPQMILNQKRREMGRMVSSRAAGDSETPMSMFDLTRSAARAFSRNVSLGQPSRQSAEEARNNSAESARPGSSGMEEDDGQNRVRRRDMVANAVSGGLASGIGWVLGAKPVSQQQQPPG